MISELLVIMILVTGGLWIFGVEGRKIVVFYIGILSLVIIGVVLGVGVQISYIILPIIGG